MNEQPAEKKCKCGEDSICSMIRDFYNKKMIPMIILTFGYSILFIVIAIFSAMQFFKTTETKCQIMYAAIFIAAIQFIVLMKIFVWQIIHRNGLKRELKKIHNKLDDLKK